MNWFQKNASILSAPGFWRQFLRLLLVALANWTSVRLGLLVVAQPEGVASIWPASGLALAVLLISPRRQWPVLLGVIFVTNALGNLAGGNSIMVSLGFALANTFEAFLAAWVLTYLCGLNISFGRVVEVIALFGVAILCNGLSALLGASVSSFAFGAPFGNAWLVWWTSDGLGMVLVAPLIVIWVTSRSIFKTSSPSRIVEAIFLVIILIIFTWLLFGPFNAAEQPILRNYMLFPFLIWLAFRFSPRAMASALTLIAAIAIWNTLQGYGIFGFITQTVTQHLVSVQMLLSVLAFTGLLLSTLINERKRAEAQIQKMNSDLEQRVKERTRELQEAQEKLIRHEKLAVLGQLAGGVGHELRNPLAVISNAIYYLKLVQPDADEKIRHYYDMVQSETHNAEKIITDLLDFASSNSIQPEQVPASELIQRALARHPVPQSVTITLLVPADLPDGLADLRQMEQILGNLVVNACQAMPEGGKLTISAHVEQGMLAVAVQDNGIGILPDNMSKLFEPLFTTRAKGIGLGLAVSRKLAEANGGRIEVESQLGKGSTFTLFFPVFVGENTVALNNSPLGSDPSTLGRNP